MRITTMLHASPLLLVLTLAASAGCGSKVVAGGGSGGTGTGGTSSGDGGSTSFTACNGPGQCELVGTGCCGSCGTPELTGKTAVNSAQADAYFKSVCPEPVPCPACAEQPNPNLFAYCDSGNCRAVDVRTDALSACNTDADCRLRFGTDCCESCSGDTSQLVAVSVSNDLGALTCSPNEDCPGCIPGYPPGAIAICNAGHCMVDLAGGG